MEEGITICLNYESVIRHIYSCKRGDVFAAEAGLIRHLQDVCSKFELNPEDPQKAFEYGLSIGTISAFLVSAIEILIAHDDKNDKLKRLKNDANKAESKNELLDVIKNLSLLLEITK